MSYLEFEWKGQLYKIDKLLAETLASLVYNVQDDWDFCVVITGNRLVRTGKSVLCMTCCAFCAYLLKKLGLNDNAYDEDHIFFDSKQMLDKVQEFPKNSIVHLDEARESLAASKTAMQTQTDVLDFFAECGALNHLFFLVMPDYFEMKENMSVSRSEILLNVFRESSIVHKDFMGDGIKRPIVMFKRGYFRLYNREAKALMYDLFRTTRAKNYNSVKPTFPTGMFINQYCGIDEKKYRQMKADALARFKEKHNPANKKSKREIELDRREGLLLNLLKERGIPQKDIAERLDISRISVGKLQKKGLFDQKSDTGYVNVN